MIFANVEPAVCYNCFAQMGGQRAEKPGIWILVLLRAAISCHSPPAKNLLLVEVHGVHGRTAESEFARLKDQSAVAEVED
jgi:hypothetical protein